MIQLVAFNKPFNVLSQFRADSSHQTVADFIHDKELRIAGRLDLDSEGLLLLTNHGQLNQHISNPKHKQWKTYLAQVDGAVHQEAIFQLQQGVMLKDGMTRPAQVRQIDEPDWLWQRTPPIRFRANIPTSWLEIKICEGRNRQVRRMTASVGFPTLRLIRTQIGSIHLQDLQLMSGETQVLTIKNYAEFHAFTLQKPSRLISHQKTKNNRPSSTRKRY